MAKARTKAATAGATVTTLKPDYDLMVTGGRVIDPANGVDRVADVAVKKGRIAAVAPKLDGRAAKVIDAKSIRAAPAR
jgi:dihydroorotase